MKMELQPIGFVSSTYEDAKNPAKENQIAIIEIKEEFATALLHIEMNSHLWILSWFHESKRDVLTVAPKRIDPNLPRFGVFALRSPYRPNPVGLSLVKLVKVEGNKLHVQNYDAIDGTPVIDIKPYFENDGIFSPKTPDIFPASEEMKLEKFTSMAYNHHQKKCPGLVQAVKMALVANKHFGILTNTAITLHVEGSGCLVDALQGITRARIAHPARLSYKEEAAACVSVWRKGNEKLTIRLNDAYKNIDEVEKLEEIPVDSLFTIMLEKRS